MVRVWIAGLAGCVVAACDGGGGAVLDAAELDAPADAEVDARPLGMIDGRCDGQPGRPRVLVYTYENLFRHVSNYYARGALYEMCASRGFSVTTTNDPDAINATRLAEHDVVVFAVTSGPGLDRLGRDDLEAWIRAGGGTVGFEAAAATEPQWPFFVDHIGAAFLTHPPTLLPGTLRLEGGPHPITEGFPATKVVTEQWYVFKTRPEEVPGLRVLQTLDETTLPPEYPDDLRVGYHAITWVHERDGGRVFYTALGDNPETFADPQILEMIGRGIEWAAGDR